MRYIFLPSTHLERHAMSSSTQDTVIVKAAIYPPIGIARVGNSPSEYFLGPEVPEPASRPAG